MKIWFNLLRSVSLVVLLAVCNIGAQASNGAAKGKGKAMDTIKTYMSFSEIDPAHILTMSDLEMSFALGSTLVAFNGDRKMVAGLAEKWETLPPTKIRFTLRKDLKWSDGSAVTAHQYKDALERAKKTYPNDLKALFDAVANIDAIDSSTLVITTKEEVTRSGILSKLTEPMYGLVSVKNGKLDLSRSAGPYYVKEKSQSHISLAVNPHWYMFRKDMPAKVEIRRPTSDADLIENFESDDWANLVSGSSLMRSDTFERFKKKGYRTWQRTLDKVFALYPSKKFLKTGGSEFINRLSIKMNRQALLAGLSGYALANQFFPRGYELYSIVDPKTALSENTVSKGSIHIIIPGGPFANVVKERLPHAIHSATGANISIEIVPLTGVNERMKRGDYDILATSVAVADPNFEGAMSFFIEREPPFIQSSEKPNDFASQLKEARSLPSSEQRADRMREIIIHAQETGCVLPLFHFSSLAIAKPGVDLSEIPNTDETIPFSKVRMR